MTPKSPNGTINRNALTKIVTAMVQAAGGLSSSKGSRTRLTLFQLRATVETITIDSNRKHKLTQKIIEFLSLVVSLLFFLLGFQKLGEQANISSSFRQRLFVFLFLEKLYWLTDFCKAGKRRISPSAIIQLLLAIFLRYYPNQNSKRFKFLTKAARIKPLLKTQSYRKYGCFW